MVAKVKTEALINGNTMVQYILRGEHPSISADSSISMGTLFTAPDVINVLIGTVRAQKHTLSPKRLLVRCILLVIFAKGIISA